MKHAALTGLLVGICVLFRGVATYFADFLCGFDLATMGYESGLDPECHIGSWNNFNGGSIFHVCHEEIGSFMI